MNIENTVTLTGTLKNLRHPKRGNDVIPNRLNGWLTQRDVSRMSNGDADRVKFVVGLNITANNESVIKDLEALDKARQGADETIPVTVTGRLTSYVRKAQTVGGKDEFVNQVEVYSVAWDNA